MEEWRRAVKDKLDAVESVYKIASENFTISWERRGRIVELFGWYVLLFGWLVLLGLEIYFFRNSAGRIKNAPVIEESVFDGCRYAPLVFIFIFFSDFFPSVFGIVIFSVPFS